MTTPTPAPKPIRYFVSFSNGEQTGSTEVHLHHPIRSMKDIYVVQRILADAGAHGAVVLGWQRFEDEQ
ncbi:hypothetical protein [Solwaraspora sp. WMMD792]|uniref:hypothetical protein n=1 Tax=Solwaraspora sp. WMMD792 TaxID=3016099 RepID=UPI002416BC58|nr:hypothetical protein [Solwaraspora sp. WMMD792]MDG4770691.1 hypothetical protein [Solwaraspora sp. WMMD792]